MYIVEGGHHKDFTFSEIEKYESYGPFDTYQEAYDAWKANMWRNVDDGQHRLYIKEVIQMRPGTTKDDSIRLMKAAIAESKEQKVCKFCGKLACFSCLQEGDLELVTQQEFEDYQMKLTAEFVGVKING